MRLRLLKGKVRCVSTMATKPIQTGKFSRAQVRRSAEGDQPRMICSKKTKTQMNLNVGVIRTFWNQGLSSTHQFLYHSVQYLHALTGLCARQVQRGQQPHALRAGGNREQACVMEAVHELERR